MLKTTIVCAALLGIVALTLASSGGGRKKSSPAPLAAFIPLKSSGGFTLRTNPVYSGSHLFNAQNNRNYILVNSVVTYQRGNTTYIVPARYRISANSRMPFRSNLNVIDLKIRLCK